MAQAVGGSGAVLDTADIREAIIAQADRTARAQAPNTARVVRAELAVLETDTALARRLEGWAGLPLRDAVPLRLAGGLHHLVLTGADTRLAPVYQGLVTSQQTVDAIVADLAVRFEAPLLPWLDHPPQTNEAGRSAAIMAGLLWLSGMPGAGLGPRFALTEIGASAGINTMMDRYFYDLGGVTAGRANSPMRVAPEWRGAPPPDAPVEIASVKGCDIRPIDLADPDQALRLKAYVWPDARERMARMDSAIALAAEAPPDLASADAADFVRDMLAAPQERGVTRALFHTVFWQYLPEATAASITAMMEQAGRAATGDRPLAWLSLEADPETLLQELRVRWWAGGNEGGAGVSLALAHPHGKWIEWREGGTGSAAG